MAKPKKKAAPKPKKVAATPKPKTPTRREASQSPGPGHNINELRALAEPHFEKLFTLQADMDSDAAGYRADFKNAYEDASNETGLKKSILIKEFRRALKIKRELEKERMLAADERGAIETLRAAMDGTPMGDYFAGLLAEPNTPTEGEAAEAEAEKEGAD